MSKQRKNTTKKKLIGYKQLSLEQLIQFCALIESNSKQELDLLIKEVNFNKRQLHYVRDYGKGRIQKLQQQAYKQAQEQAQAKDKASIKKGRSKQGRNHKVKASSPLDVQHKTDSIAALIEDKEDEIITKIKDLREKGLGELLNRFSDDRTEEIKKTPTKDLVALVKFADDRIVQYEERKKVNESGGQGFVESLMSKIRPHVTINNITIVQQGQNLEADKNDVTRFAAQNAKKGQ